MNLSITHSSRICGSLLAAGLAHNIRSSIIGGVTKINLTATNQSLKVTQKQAGPKTLSAPLQQIDFGEKPTDYRLANHPHDQHRLSGDCSVSAINLGRYPWHLHRGEAK